MNHFKLLNCVAATLLENCSNVGQIGPQFGQKWVHLISRISRNFSREIGRFFSQKLKTREMCMSSMNRFQILNMTYFSKHISTSFCILFITVKSKPAKVCRELRMKSLSNNR